MASCYVYEHLEFRADIPGPVAFALLFLERRQIVEKRSNPNDMSYDNYRVNILTTCQLGNHYALITGNFRPIQLMRPGIG